MSQGNGLDYTNPEVRRAELQRLAALDPELDYPWEREKAAEKMGRQPKEIDRAVKKLRVGPAPVTDPNAIVRRALLPELPIQRRDLPAAAAALADHFAQSGCLFDRGGPVKLVRPANGGMPEAKPLTADAVIFEAHKVCRPVWVKPDNSRKEDSLPPSVAKLYLGMLGEWRLPPLRGICTTPLLEEAGGIRTAEGYDSETGLWCQDVPSVSVPERPTRRDAELAVQRLRTEFRTFPFGESSLLQEGAVAVIDLAQSPSIDESAFLAGLLTAVCRSCLSLAPGLMISAPADSGSGAGKGLLVRGICTIAFAYPPIPFTAGENRQEFNSRLVGKLVEGSPCIAIDNCNNRALASEQLDSALTEAPFSVRQLGSSAQLRVERAPFVTVTGNALTPGRDAVRRFLYVLLDPRCEHPEARELDDAEFLERLRKHRVELLSAALTIWRWGRRQGDALPRGKPYGSYAQWCRWVRDPLLALDCVDPVARVADLKANDPERQATAELFTAFAEKHGDEWVKVADLDPTIRATADPKNKGESSNAVTKFLDRKVGSRVAGYVLTSYKTTRWTPAVYRVVRTDDFGA